MLLFQIFIYLCNRHPFLHRKRMFLYENQTCICYKSLITSSFALSIVDVSIDARYICVVEMESWPRASDMTLTDMFLFVLCPLVLTGNGYYGEYVGRSLVRISFHQFIDLIDYLNM